MEDFNRDPYTAYEEARQRGSIFFDNGLHSWVILDYESAKEVISQPERYASGRSLHNWPLYHDDGTLHRERRRLLSEIFSPSKVEQLSPKIESICASLFESFESGGDFVEKIAKPLAIQSSLLAIGIQPEVFHEESSWFSPIVEALSGNDALTQSMAIDRIRRLFQGALAQRSFIDGGLLARCSGAEEAKALEDICVLILGAGIVTGSNQNASIAYRMATTPSLQVGHAALPYDEIVEETLRLDSSLQWISRKPREDVVLQGQHLKEGINLLVSVAAANRDPRVFEDPYQFRLGRSVRSLAFGYGPHYCVGAALARTQARAVLNSLGSMAHLQLTAPAEMTHSMVHYGFRHLYLGTGHG